MQRVSRLFRLSPGVPFRPLSLSTRPIVNFTLSNRPLLTHEPKFVFKTTSPLRNFVTQSPKPSSPPITPNQSAVAPSPAVVAPKNESRVKLLIRNYGWSAFVVYHGIGAIELSITFIALKQAGGDRVRELEDWLSDKLGWRQSKPREEDDTTATSGQPSFATLFAIAYAIHKTIFLPVRIGATAAITPPLVKALQRRGWNIGVKAAQKAIPK